jgi:mRNA interferase MazF
MRRGEIWWASLPNPQGSGPGFRRPVVIVQSNPFNESRIQTVVVAVITSNLTLAAAPGNVRLSARQTKLARDSVVNVSQIITVDRSVLSECVGRVSPQRMSDIDAGLRLVLAL